MTETLVHILICDDETRSLAELKTEFESCGFRVSTALHPAEAYDFYLNNKKEISVILSKIKMRVGDGFGLLNLVRTAKGDTPFVLFSPDSLDISPEDFFDRGVNGFVIAPRSKNEIVEGVNSAIQALKLGRNRSTQRVATSLSIKLEFATLAHSFVSKMINIGVGGMFISCDKNLPHVGDEIHFKVNFQGERFKHLTGSGVVKWVREQSTDLLPLGFGIEFTHLEDESEKILKDLIIALQTRSYIPKA